MEELNKLKITLMNFKVPAESANIIVRDLSLLIVDVKSKAYEAGRSEGINIGAGNNNDHDFDYLSDIKAT